MKLVAVTLQGFEFYQSGSNSPGFSMKKIEKMHEEESTPIDCWVFDQ